MFAKWIFWIKLPIISKVQIICADITIQVQILYVHVFSWFERGKNHPLPRKLWVPSSWFPKKVPHLHLQILAGSEDEALQRGSGRRNIVGFWFLNWYAKTKKRGENLASRFFFTPKKLQKTIFWKESPFPTHYLWYPFVRFLRFFTLKCSKLRQNERWSAGHCLRNST